MPPCASAGAGWPLPPAPRLQFPITFVCLRMTISLRLISASFARPEERWKRLLAGCAATGARAHSHDRARHERPIPRPGRHPSDQ
jgi:hypothetical protein